MIRLVLSDMDNTLVPFGQGRVSARTLEAIHEVLDAGVLFGPATGRDYVELMRFFQGDESGFMTGIFSNGKRVRADGRYVRTVLLDHESLVRIDEALRGEKGMFLVCYPEATDLTNPAYGVGATREELEVFARRPPTSPTPPTAWVPRARSSRSLRGAAPLPAGSPTSCPTRTSSRRP